nr:disks large-associated protein 5-like isoform X1 [Nomia melanderi]XP_031836347.1 disks large-associated protein 5-like isoform X2 [Nomia melanderi]
MAGFQSKYKCKPLGFGDAVESQFVRTENHKNWRKNKRNQFFNENRNILDSTVNNAAQEMKSSSVNENRMVRLLKWREERDRRKKLEQIKKKPPFVVGTVHHKLYSPGMKDEPDMITKKVCKSNVPGTLLVPTKRITRATEKRLLYKALTNNATKVQTNPANPEKNKQSKVPKEKEYSFAPDNYKFKPPEGLPQILFGRVTCSMTPVISTEPVSSFSKITRASRRSSYAKLTVEQVNSKLLNTSYTIEKEQDDDNIEEGSIEPIVLKLSFGEEEEFLSGNENDNKSGRNSDNDSQENEKFSEKLNESKKNRKLGNSKKDIEISEKFNHSTKDDKSSKKFNDSGKKFNITIRDNIKDTCDTINNTSKESEPFTNDNTPKSLQSDSSNEPASLSPYVVSSRGKSNARKEQQIKRGFSFSRSTNDNIPTKETVMKNLNISVDEEERTAQYFEFLLNKEIDRQKKLCEKWSKIKEEPGITEDAQYQINQAIGQANLLMNKKFQRFRSLVFDCATGKGEMLVTCNDLQGFWDMMYMEVENCTLRFEKLEQLRLRNWEEEQVSVVGKPLTKKKVTKKKALHTKSSNVRAFLAKKKQSMTEKAQSDVGAQQFGILNNKNENSENRLNTKYTSRKSISLCDDRPKLSLLEKVQFSDTKKFKSPLTIMKISKMCKVPEICLDDTISYTNSNQTPAKSILKQSRSSVKATHEVNFDDSLILNENPISEEFRIKKDLATAFANIDSLNFDCASEETPIHTERELVYNDSSFEESENSTNANKNLDITKPTEEKKCMQIHIPSIKIESATPLQEPILHDRSNISSPRKLLQRQNALHCSDDCLSSSIVASTPLKKISNHPDLNTSKEKLQKNVSISDTEEIDKHGDNTRVLRNRSIITGNTSIQKQKFSRSLCDQGFEHKENTTPTKTKRKSLRKVSIKDDKIVNSKIDLHDAIAHMSLEENSGRRRSTRKSVKFDENKCSGCLVKPAFPVTPHVRRSRKSIKSKEEV